METQNKNTAGKKPKKLMLILAGALLLIAVILIAVMASKNNKPQVNNQPQANQTETTEVADGEPKDASTPIDTVAQEANIASLEGAKVVVPGANPITADNKVVTQTGKVTENEAMPMTENAPKQTGFLNKEELAKGVLNFTVGNGKFAPSSFGTKIGVPTTFTLTAVDAFAHVITFDDASLAAIAILVGPGQTRGITFNAPAAAGEYTFRCAAPGHADAGEVGKMIVK